jgi:pimeloyl-ACP methyl ester carboxylesterase
MKTPGTPVVCVPGLGLRSDDWRAASRRLADLVGSAPSVRELPGYGARPRRGDDLDPAALGAQLAAELPPGSVLLGHSASCQVVAHAAAAAPGKVGAVVLVGPTTDPSARTWPHLAGRWLATAARERPWQVPLLVRDYSRTGLGHMARAMNAARHDDIRQVLAGVGRPVLVVRGRHDRICPAGWASRVAAAAPGGGHVVTLDAGAHMVPLTHPRPVATAVAAWLDGLPSGA